MQRAGPTLEALVKELGMEDALRLYRIRKSWVGTLGSPLCLHTFPAMLSGGRLNVNVDTAAWLQQVGFYRSLISKKLSRFGVADVRFRLGRVESCTDAPADTGPLLKGSPDHEFIEEMLAELKDEELKESLRRAAEKGIRTTESA